MTRPPAKILGLVLGAVFLLFGIIEVVTHRSDTAGALAFWGLSLLGEVPWSSSAPWCERPGATWDSSS